MLLKKPRSSIPRGVSTKFKWKFLFKIIFKSVIVIIFKVFFFKYIKIIFFIFKKLFLISVHQNNIKILKIY